MKRIGLLKVGFLLGFVGWNLYLMGTPVSATRVVTEIFLKVVINT
jgi:hypothetical protein